MEHNKGYSYDFQGDAQKHEAQILWVKYVQPHEVSALP